LPSPFAFQVHTYRFTGHSPADPEHERGRKEEKRWARAEADPIVIFEEVTAPANGITEADLEACRAEAKATVKKAVEFADASSPPPAGLAKVSHSVGRRLCGRRLWIDGL